MPIVEGKVRTAIKRSAVGHQEHRHRPTALAGHRLDSLHVDAIQVRPFLAIDFDIYEAIVHETRRLFVLERLVRHDVTPMARSVADAQEDGLVFALCLLECLTAPRKPVDRIPGVLEQVRARLIGESIRHYLVC